MRTRIISGYNFRAARNSYPAWRPRALWELIGAYLSDPAYRDQVELLLPGQAPEQAAGLACTQIAQLCRFTPRDAAMRLHVL